MKITDEMVETFDTAYDACACPTPRTRYCCIRAGVEAAAPLIAAQALRSVDADRIARAIGDPGSVVPRRLGSTDNDHSDIGETVTRWSTRAVLAVLAGEPDRCCARPNMVWEHPRGGKDHFRCAGCGGGMTKARTVAP